MLTTDQTELQNPLPKGIGQPAARALASIGITMLDPCAYISDAEMALLHGMGPKAIRIIREALNSLDAP